MSFTFLVIFKSGWTFYHHNYYILVFTPVFIIPIAYFLKDKSGKLITYILLVVAIEGVSSQYHEFRVKDTHKKLLLLEEILNKHFKKEDKIAFNTGNIPTAIYFSHRKGITLKNEVLKDESSLLTLKDNDIKGIVIMKKVFGEEIHLDHPKVFESEDFKIYRLEQH